MRTGLEVLYVLSSITELAGSSAINYGWAWPPWGSSDARNLPLIPCFLVLAVPLMALVVFVHSV